MRSFNRLRGTTSGICERHQSTGTTLRAASEEDRGRRKSDAQGVRDVVSSYLALPEATMATCADLACDAVLHGIDVDVRGAGCLRPV